MREANQERSRQNWFFSQHTNYASKTQLYIPLRYFSVVERIKQGIQKKILYQRRKNNIFLFPFRQQNSKPCAIEAVERDCFASSSNYLFASANASSNGISTACHWSYKHFSLNFWSLNGWGELVIWHLIQDSD